MNEKYGMVVRAAERKRREDERLARGEAAGRLRAAATTRIRTTMVGAISAAEEVLGHLWGQGKSESELTDREFRLNSLWQQVRKRIFDVGNQQIRCVEAEIEAFENGGWK